MRITSVEQADQITMAWIAQNVDLDQARFNWQQQPHPNSMTRYVFVMPELGTWQVNPYLGDIEVLVEVPVESFQPSEGDWEFAIQYPETRLYVQWQKEGFIPPPLSLIRTFKEPDGQGGMLRTQNRRRWLAAREAGTETLYCWYSPTHETRCASPKWSTKYLEE